MDERTQAELTLNQPLSAPKASAKQNYKLLIVIACLFYLLMAGGLSYLGYQNFQLQQKLNQFLLQEDVNQASLTPSPLPNSNPSMSDATADWETYTSPDYSFKHPSYLKSDTGAAGTGFESIRFQYMGPKQIASGRTQTSLFDGYSFVVTKISSTTQKTPEQWATERRNNSKDNCGTEVVLSEIKQITVGKASGVQYSVENCMGDYTSSYLSYRGNIYEVTQLYVGEEADQGKYEEITKQIFSTLKFQ